jgi:hypothetical protein
MILRGMSLRVLQCFVAALMVGVVLAQTLGFMHRSVHSPLTESGYGRQAESGEHAQHHEAADTGDCNHGWISRLFSHSDGDSTCRLVDAQSTFDGAFLAPAQAYIAQPAINLIAFSQITSTARAAALFEARGPPGSL